MRKSSHKTHIVFLITSLGYGGAEAQVCRVVTSLVERGWNVTVVRLFRSENERPLPGIAVHTVGMLPGRINPWTIVRLLRILRSLRASCLITFNYPANVSGRIVGALLRIPVVISSFRVEKFGSKSRETFGSRLRERVLTWTDPLATISVTNSHCVRSSLINAGIAKKDRITVIRNAIDLEIYRPCPESYLARRSELGICEKEFVWLAVGRLEPQKAYPDLLQSIRLLTELPIPPIKLLVIGSGPCEGDLHRLISELGIGDIVELLGRRTDVPDFLQAADAVVLSSLWEGLPNVVLEAMATATPVVATSVGGVSELVVDEESGLLALPGNPQSLADSMQRMMCMSSNQRRKMGETGRLHIKAHFELTKIVDEWEDLLCKYISPMDLQQKIDSQH